MKDTLTSRLLSGIIVVFYYCGLTNNVSKSSIQVFKDHFLGRPIHHSRDCVNKEKPKLYVVSSKNHGK